MCLLYVVANERTAHEAIDSIERVSLALDTAITALKACTSETDDHSNRAKVEMLHIQARRLASDWEKIERSCALPA